MTKIIIQKSTAKYELKKGNVRDVRLSRNYAFTVRKTLAT